MIPYGRQSITDEDIDAVVAVLKSDYLTQGEMVPAFEQGLADYCQVPHVIACSNGTTALHLACTALALGTDDWVWVSAISFVASANCARYCGIQVDFVDVEPDTGNLCVAALREKLHQVQGTPRQPKALIAVHLAGQPCDLAEIGALCRQYDVHLIEDACHALGASYQGDPIGSCAHSDMTVFSFHPVKPISDGGRGRGDHPQCRAGGQASPLSQPWYHPGPRSIEHSQSRRLVLRAAGTGFQLPPDRHPGGTGLKPAPPPAPVYRPSPAVGRPLRRPADPAAGAAPASKGWPQQRLPPLCGPGRRPGPGVCAAEGGRHRRQRPLHAHSGPALLPWSGP
ncbi:lipopolysaccharide O-Ag biosynthesis protein FlmB [Aeromonas molluscorum 848]|uniref:Lipopolysaccharide O-Ag biosynthesis protein FlmB n=1 Tax=Aeromonas molluscorum 848 TaxID=1268236 RepID=R1H1Y9_9GAMM|nr:lipopolysaccharide O-Ag biosynthesis protein FlmB [Aeromonas molluscorum 848]